MVNNAMAIEVDGLTVRRGKSAVLEDLTFGVRAGAVVGLLGPSGCGKSTLMRSIVGTQVVHGGTIRVFDEPAGSAPLRQRVGYMTQAASVYDDLTVHQNLDYFRKVLRTGRDRVGQVLDLTDLADTADQLVDNLSGGQRSRVSLAVALLGEPDLLVLDEPTVGLDPVLRADLWALFRRLAADGATLLVSSHVMDEATRCDRLLLMRDGDIIADDSPDGLLAATGTETAEAAFLALISGPGKTAQPASTHARHRQDPGLGQGGTP
ncbi:ABC transporter ATP-binding protein [Arthrobacter sp. JSM 101049]|uniref:ABC transporter ATP-binding protein n=1 Tax=Arthrobacter sp. JSM 101049 TaxID=929097 RepID=UPI00356B269B